MQLIIPPMTPIAMIAFVPDFAAVIGASAHRLLIASRRRVLPPAARCAQRQWLSVKARNWRGLSLVPGNNGYAQGVTAGQGVIHHIGLDAESPSSLNSGAAPVQSHDRSGGTGGPATARTSLPEAVRGAWRQGLLWRTCANTGAACWRAWA